jgi:hypothetical protein
VRLVAATAVPVTSTVAAAVTAAVVGGRVARGEDAGRVQEPGDAVAPTGQDKRQEE